jgi:predicted lipid-binding transport protein (Tim44 family)
LADDTKRRKQMKTMLRIAVVAAGLVMMVIADLALVPEAHAIFGTQRRTAVVVGATVHAADSAQTAQAEQQAAAAQQHAAAAKQETAVAQQQAAAAQQQAAAAQPQPAAAAPAPAPAAAGTPLPLGTVVAALPAGCVSTPVGGVEYYRCGAKEGLNKSS